jgi:DNA polymerase elongation subunit (family B)
MDNSKYFYLNVFYNFLTACLDMNKIHVIYGDTDSLYLAIADKNWPIKDK